MELPLVAIHQQQKTRQDLQQQLLTLSVAPTVWVQQLIWWSELSMAAHLLLSRAELQKQLHHTLSLDPTVCAHQLI